MFPAETPDPLADAFSPASSAIRKPARERDGKRATKQKQPSFGRLKRASVTVSRVLYWAIIYPGPSLPKGSSDHGKCGEQPTIPASCTGWGLQHGPVTRPAGELLPRLSILTGDSPGGLFLLHFPWSRLRRPLAGTPALWCPDFPHAQKGTRSPVHLARDLLYPRKRRIVNDRTLRRPGAAFR